MKKQTISSRVIITKKQDKTLKGPYFSQMMEPTVAKNIPNIIPNIYIKP
jgi:hypothetical protein